MASTTYSAIARARGVVWCATLLILVSAMALCCKRREESVGHVLLHRADSALIADADTLALGILTAMEDSIVDALSEEDRALYAVLVNQALDRNDYAVDDSLAQAAAYYYLNNNVGDDYHEGLAYYYMGHSLKEKNDITALKWYNYGKDKFQECENMRYEFLCWNYMGVVSSIHRDAYDALFFYKRALNIAKQLNNQRYINTEYSEIASCYVQINKNDSAQLYIDSIPMEFMEKVPDVYETLSVIAFRDGDLSNAEALCDSALKYGMDEGVVGIILFDISLSKKEYEKAYDLVRQRNVSNIYETVVKFDQLSKVYEEMGFADSSIVYRNKYVELTDSIEVVENHDVAIKELFNNRHDDVWPKFFIVLIVISIICFVIFVVLSIRNHSLRKNIKKSEEEINELKKVVFEQIQLNHVHSERIDSALEVMFSLLGKEYIAQSAIDGSLTARQKKKILFNILNKYFPSISDKITEYYNELDEEDVICMVGASIGIPYQSISEIIMRSKSDVNMRLKRVTTKLSKRNLNSCHELIKKFVIDALSTY